MDVRIIGEEKAACFVAVAGGVIFWLGYGLVEGLLFCIAIFLILQPPILISWWFRRRRK